MSTPPPDPPQNPESASRWTNAIDRGSRFWLIPLATFLVGLLLGGGVVALVSIGSDDDTPAGQSESEESSATTSAAPTPTGPASVTIPGDCIQIATDAQALLDLADQAAQAARDLDADALSEVVAELRKQQEALSTQADDCQSAAAEENSTSTP